MIDALGYAAALERAGVEIIYGTSLTLMMRPQYDAGNRILRRVVSDSAKTTRYSRVFGMHSSFHPIEECVEAAVTGRVRPASREGER